MIIGGEELKNQDKYKKYFKSKGCKPRKGYVIKCDYCSKLKYRRKSLVERTGRERDFCSKKCSISFSKENAFSFECKICGDEVYTQPSQIKYRNRKTCSVECKGKLARKRAERGRGIY